MEHFWSRTVDFPNISHIPVKGWRHSIAKTKKKKKTLLNWYQRLKRNKGSDSENESREGDILLERPCRRRFDGTSECMHIDLIWWAWYLATGCEEDWGWGVVEVKIWYRVHSKRYPPILLFLSNFDLIYFFLRNKIKILFYH